MKILLIGDYSNLHWTLATGLRLLGNQVTVASDGDGFKNYPRDIDLTRKSSTIPDTFAAIGKVYKNLNNFKSYDIVQLINPCFTTLNTRINRLLYKFLKKNNGKVYLGAFGDDYYWLKACLSNSIFRYSEFYQNNVKCNMKFNLRLEKQWLNTDRETLNKQIAEDCDGIIACLPEYYMAYKPYFADKLTYIPLPINLDVIPKSDFITKEKVQFFIGINTIRSEFKGTDRLYKVLLQLRSKYPQEVEIKDVYSLPYDEYVKSMSNAHVVLDQLYSYSPAMNGLLTLAQGKILVGGGEPEVYELLHENNCKPIINVVPDENDIYNKLETLVLNKQKLKDVANQSRYFVERHHDYIKVAQQYIDHWSK